MNLPRRTYRKNRPVVSTVRGPVAILLRPSPLALSGQLAAIHTPDIMVEPSTARLKR